ncbi:uncharacterized protein PV09_07279 [Verruconis gallopava]|uniref:Phosphoglycerate mutase n=1 Tax=Verruconis gallopava TaxID=253628 RepID=A0A0D1XGB1_9PEZI|nr:uncharacterized protein PV09_07279 [Verruconis gallopava]KIW01236.1 hypothetical protein PV09_07279 [Verruconis gallopava]
MRVFLIRHGETVDNVANVYGGSRDSELTNHGVQQATRLGQHFAASDVRFTHILSSQLRRAVKTAELVRAAQPEVRDARNNVVSPVVMQLSELAEQDFGSYEGVSFLARQSPNKASGKGPQRTVDKNDPGFVDMESKESMQRRADAFLEQHLVPLVRKEAAMSPTVAVVSHGVILSVLWRRLRSRLPSGSVTLHPEVVTKYGPVDVEKLGGWSNTGYLEMNISYKPMPISVPGTMTSESAKAKETMSALAADRPVTSNALEGWSVTVCAVNSRHHLVGLKRTGGGVGSAPHDDKQQRIDAFVKRRKVEQ